VPPLDKADVAQSQQKLAAEVCRDQIRRPAARIEETQADEFRLLPASSERPRGSSAGEQRDELAPSHIEHRASSRLAPPVSLPHAQPAAEGAGKSLGST
jgi:hypothetical protein